MSNPLLIDETFAAEMAEKKAMLDNIASQLGGITSPYTYMTVAEYLDTNIDPSKVYWVLADNGKHGIYKNGNWCEGEKVIPSWDDIQEWVRTGTFTSYYSVGDQLNVKYNGNKMAWDIVAIDVTTPADTSKTHSVTLMPHNMFYDYRVFDAPEPNNPDSYRKSYGNNRYAHSAIRQWLNSSADAGNWWTAQHEYDAAPSYATTANGFMKGFDADFLAVLGLTKIKVAKNTVTDGGGYEELTDTFYLPSRMEVGLGRENSIEEGVQFPYFTDNASRKKYREGTSSASYWWLRTPGSGTSYAVRRVSSSGALNVHNACHDYGVAPACNII